MELRLGIATDIIVKIYIGRGGEIENEEEMQEN